MWGLTAVVYSVCMYVKLLKTKDIWESVNQAQIYFLFSVKGLPSSQRFLFPIMLYQKFYFLAIEIFFYGIRVSVYSVSARFYYSISLVAPLLGQFQERGCYRGKSLSDRDRQRAREREREHTRELEREMNSGPLSFFFFLLLYPQPSLLLHFHPFPKLCLMPLLPLKFYIICLVSDLNNFFAIRP